jgi:hypothetical protein
MLKKLLGTGGIVWFDLKGLQVILQGWQAAMSFKPQTRHQHPA